jgi:hypothetical protein
MVFKLEAIEREGGEGTWPFDFDGHRYHLPSDFDWRAANALTKGDIELGLELLLGDEQWQRMQASPKVFGVKAIVNMLNAYATDIGVDLGEFQASSASSKRTVAPSKRTSNGSTGSRSRASSPARKR